LVKTSGRKPGSWLGWPWKRAAPDETEAAGSPAGEGHLALAQQSLRRLLDDPRLPAGVREALAPEFAEVERMLQKLEQGEIHIAVLGEVSVGKSSLLNALLGEARFTTSPLHGETRVPAEARWQETRSGRVHLRDTPGINEIGGEERERMAREVADQADLVLFVVDGDLNASEQAALEQALAPGPSLSSRTSGAQQRVPRADQIIDDDGGRSGYVTDEQITGNYTRAAPFVGKCLSDRARQGRL
jgi:GTPase